MRKYFILSTALLLLVITGIAQNPQQKSPFIIRLQQVEIDQLPALQSFAYATWQDKWLLVGGRKDGLHRRQPWAAFDEDEQIHICCRSGEEAGMETIFERIACIYTRATAKYEHAILSN